MEYWGFDIETTGLDPNAADAEILTAVAYNPTAGAVHTQDVVAGILADKDAIIVGHNLVSFDVVWWRTHVGEVNARMFDTRVAYSLIDETGEKNSLAALTEKYLGYSLDTDMKSKRKKLKDLPYEEVLKYNIGDSKASYELGHVLNQALIDANQMELFDWLMNVIAPPLVDMMVRGVLIDVDHVRREGEAATRDIERLSYELNVMANRRPDLPEEFRPRDAKPLLNVDSSQQLAAFLYDELGLPILEQTKGGKPSTRAAVIAQLRRTIGNKYSIVGDFLQRLLDYRESKKLVGTYLTPLIVKHLGVSGRVHTSYFLGRGYDRGKRGGTVTGRLSSSDPNLQNIPRDKKVKGAFIPSYGYRMFEADYAQLELRVAAWYSREGVMLDAFAQGRDIHTATLATIEERDYDDVVAELQEGTNLDLKEKRALVKRVNFGVLYGTGAHKLQELMRDMGQEVSFKQTQETITKWFAAYPDLSAWITQIQEEAAFQGEVETPTGRKRHLPDARSAEKGLRNRAMRQAVNFLVQSFASDITLQGLANVSRWFDEMGEGRLLMTVHDSVVGEYTEDIKDLVESNVEWHMTDGVNIEMRTRFGVEELLPLAVDIKRELGRWGG